MTIGIQDGPSGPRGGSGGTIGGGGATTGGGSTTGDGATNAPAPPQPGTNAIPPSIIASSIQSGKAISIVQIPLSAAPSQIVATLLGTQQCRIAVYQKRTGLFLDLFVNDKAVALGILCRDRVWLIRDAYFGFTGDLAFIDTQGVADPDYTGLAGRYQLVWGN